MADKRKVTVAIEEDLLTWFKEAYPEGTFYYVINELLRELKIAHELNPPPNLFRQGAVALREKIDKDLKFMETDDD